jgi:ribosomal protein S18 acetylase RimI-like enzyme
MNDFFTLPGLTIRRATAADAALLVELGARTFADSFAADNTPEDMAAYLAASFNLPHLESELADPGAAFFIAAADTGEVVGYAKLLSGHTPPEITAPNAIELVRIYSTLPYIGRGVGSALMQACLRFAADRAFSTIWLGVWECNLRAQAFYRKWGFEVVNTHTFLLGSDPQTDYLMQRKVAA